MKREAGTERDKFIRRLKLGYTYNHVREERELRNGLTLRM